MLKLFTVVVSINYTAAISLRTRLNTLVSILLLTIDCMHDLYDHLYHSHAALYQYSLPHALYEYGLAIYGFNTVHAQYNKECYDIVASSPRHSNVFNVARRKEGGPGRRNHVSAIAHLWFQGINSRRLQLPKVFNSIAVSICLLWPLGSII